MLCLFNDFLIFVVLALDEEGCIHSARFSEVLLVRHQHPRVAVEHCNQILLLNISFFLVSIEGQQREPVRVDLLVQDSWELVAQLVKSFAEGRSSIFSAIIGIILTEVFLKRLRQCLPQRLQPSY